MSAPTGELSELQRFTLEAIDKAMWHGDSRAFRAFGVTRWVTQKHGTGIREATLAKLIALGLIVKDEQYRAYQVTTAGRVWLVKHSEWHVVTPAT